jgi:TRAP-type C4-dicarboxylate transport system permease small subunit
MSGEAQPASGRGIPLWGVLVRALEVFTILLFVLLTADVLWGVFTRYVLGGQARWSEEVATYLLVWVSLLGGALTFREQGHLGVDYIVGKLHPDAQRVAAVAAELAIILFAGFALVYGGLLLVVRNLEQVTPALGLTVGYLYAVVPLSGFFIAAFSVERLVGRSPVPAETGGRS